MHVKPVFYNFSYTKLAEQSGISHTTLRKYIPKMMKLGWCEVRHGHLKFTPINNLKTKYNCVLIPIRATKKEQMLELRHAVIVRNLYKQKWTIERKTNIVKNCGSAHGRVSAKQLKTIREAGGVAAFERSIQHCLTLSNKGYGRLIARSKETGKRLQKSLRDAGLIRTQARFALVAKNVSRLEFLYNYNYGMSLFADGNVYRRLSNAITEARVVGQKV